MIIKATKDETEGFRLSQEKSIAQAEKDAKATSKGSRKTTLPFLEIKS